MTGFSSPRCLFQLEEMDSETSVKNLKAQNAQVQVAILELAKGQQELKALIMTKKKKPKGSVGLSHLIRKVKIPVKRPKKAPIPEIVGEGEGDNHSNQGSAKPSLSLSSNEEDYHSEDEQGDDKYQQLEERMKAMEIQKVPGLDFKDLGLVSDVAIPPKFKVPVFAKYDGVSCPKLHLRSYVRKILPHTADNKLWIHFFQESL